jgi:ribokinase
MRVFNFGSLNIDHVYSVERFVRPGETIKSRSYRQFSGGKGGNQSIALAYAGAAVTHVGRIGADGTWVRDRLAESGVDVSLIATGTEATGHAIIQVSREGENAIVIYGGANQTLSHVDVHSILKVAKPGDLVLTQNETSCVDLLLGGAWEHGLFTVFNPAPMTDSVKKYPLENVGLLILNETEGRYLTGTSEPDEMLSVLLRRYPRSGIVLTLGSRGARYRDKEIDLSVPAEKVEAVDTTAAGDTFIGYFLAKFSTGADVESCLRFACKASAICVQRAGAADSIPRLAELK